MRGYRRIAVIPIKAQKLEIHLDNILVLAYALP